MTNFKIYLRSVWPTGKKERKTQIQKFKYLEKEKSFLNEIKSIFIIIQRISFNKKRKIVRTSFNLKFWSFLS